MALERPISVIVPAGTTRRISFPQEFFRDVESVIISNNDGTNFATYQINGESQPVLTLGAGEFRAINGTVIDLLIITAGALNTVQVQAIGRPVVSLE